MAAGNRTNTVVAPIMAVGLLIAIAAYFWEGWQRSGLGAATAKANAQEIPGRSSSRGASDPRSPDSVNLSDAQLASVRVEPVGEREFPIEKQAVGSIDFNEEMSVQVFTPYPGRIIGLFAKLGDDVKKGQTLFTIDSPDLLQAESTLIAAAGVLEFTTRNLARLKALYASRAVSQKDMEQASSDQQTGAGAQRAAGDAGAPVG